MLLNKVFPTFLFKFRALELMKTLWMKFWYRELTKKSEKLTESTEKVHFNAQQSKLP